MMEEVVAAIERGDAAGALTLLGGAASGDATYLHAIALAMLGRVTEAMIHARRFLAEELGDPRGLALIEQLEALGASAPAADAWAPGTLVAGRWEVFGSAEGGMGRVYFVRDREWQGKECAVKSLVVRPEASEEALRTARELFRREAQVWLDLGAHPAIVSGFYTLEVEGALRFFMEYVPGQSLGGLLAAAGSLDLPEALDLAIQLAAGMAYVHARGVVHRDLKPPNCIVTADRALRITDFGLGKSFGDVDRAAAAAPVRDGTIAAAGTPSYMPPEQWRGLGFASTTADVYAFGVTLVEMLAGRRPFDDVGWWRARADRLPALARRAVAEDALPLVVKRLLHESAPAPTLAELGVGAPPALEALCARCLAKDPAARPDFVAVRSELEHIAAGALGHPYRREIPRELGPSAAGDNNRAASYFVMGDVDKAAHILDGVLASDPGAPIPRINRALVAIARGEVDVAEVGDLLDELLGSLGEAAAGRDLRARLAADWHRHGAGVIATRTAGAHAVTAYRDGTLRRWRRDDGVTLASWHAPEAIAAIAVRGDDVAVGAASGVWSGGGLVVDVAGGVRGLAFGEDGALAFLRGDGALVRHTAIAAPPERVERVTASADLAAVVRSHAGAHVLWTPATGATATIFKELSLDPTGFEITAVASGPAGATAVAFLRIIVESKGSASAAGVLVRDGGAPVTVDLAGVVARALAFAPDGRLLVGGDDGRLRSWTRDGGLTVTAVGARAAIRDLHVDGDVVIASADDGTVRVAPLARGARRRTIPLLLLRVASAGERRDAREDCQRALAALATGDTGAWRRLCEARERDVDLHRDAALARSIARAWRGRGCATSVANTWLCGQIAARARVTHLAFADDARATLAIGTEAGRVLVADSTTAAVQNRLNGDAPLAGLAVHASGALVIVARDVRLVEPATGAMRCRWRHFRFRPTAAAAHGGDEVVTLGRDGELRRWRLADGASTVISKLPDDARGLSARVGRVAFACDESVTVIDLGTGAMQVHLMYQAAHATALAGEVVIAGGGGGVLRAWTAAPTWSVRAHAGTIDVLAVTADCRIVASGGGDGHVRLWRARDGAKLDELSLGLGPIKALAITADGDRIAATGRDGRVAIWAIDHDWSTA